MIHPPRGKRLHAPGHNSITAVWQTSEQNIIIKYLSGQKKLKGQKVCRGDFRDRELEGCGAVISSQ
jgi:hypothetical protein